MRKSEFKKLKVGDTVQLRTLDELKQLKCWKQERLLKTSGVIDDNGCFRDHVVTCYPEILGASGMITFVTHYEISIYVLGYSIEVVRQHLKGV